jgi:hypothetical protein
MLNAFYSYTIVIERKERTFMFRSCFAPALGLVLTVAFSPGFLFAAISVGGDIVPPTDPTTWNSDTGVQVGETGAGTLDINGGSELSIRYC